MKVAYVGLVPPDPGGIAQHGAATIAALGRRVDDLHVEAWHTPYPRALHPVGASRGDPGNPVAWPPVGATSACQRLRWWDPPGWLLAGGRCRDADVVVLAWWTTVHAAALATMVRRLRQPRVVALVHNPLPHRRHPGDRAATRAVLGRADGFVVHTPAVADELGKVVAIGGRPVEVVAHPPNLPLTATPQPPGPPWRLVMFGHVRPYKGLDLALAAMAELRRRDVPVTLTVAGRFWEPVGPWRQRVADAGLDGVVTLRDGYVPDDQVGGMLGDHHVVLATYRDATQSGVVPLAGAAGRACVVTPVGGLAEQVGAPDAPGAGAVGVVAASTEARDVADAVEQAIAELVAPGQTTGAGPVASTHQGWDAVADAILRAARPPGAAT